MKNENTEQQEVVLIEMPAILSTIGGKGNDGKLQRYGGRVELVKESNGKKVLHLATNMTIIEDGRIKHRFPATKGWEKKVDAWLNHLPIDEVPAKKSKAKVNDADEMDCP